MNSENNQPEQASELRLRAEEIAAEKAAPSLQDMSALSLEDARAFALLRISDIEAKESAEETRDDIQKVRKGLSSSGSHSPPMGSRSRFGRSWGRNDLITMDDRLHT